jgi:hypothetical protein
VTHQLNYRPPPPKDPQKPKRSLLEMLFAQWPFFAGLALIGLGLLYIRATYSSSITPIGRRGRGGIYLIALGVALILYWAFANKNDDYNF